MKQVLLTISFTDDTNKFWWDSEIKNKIVNFDSEKETIHDVVKKVCKDVGMELTYNGKPKGNVFREKKDGETEIIGYMYRGKGEIYDRNMVKPIMVFWDVWATINQIEKFQFEEID